MLPLIVEFSRFAYEVVSKEIIFCSQLLHSKQIRAYRRTVVRVKQIYFVRVKTRLTVRENEIFVALHREQELPPLGSVVVAVDYRQMLHSTRSSFKI